MAKSRAEVDKEMMYRKIMPSASRPGRNPAGSAENQAAGSLSPAPPNMEEAEIGSNSIPPVRPRTVSGLQVPEMQDMILTNLMEELVLSRLDSTLMRFNCCKCNKCKKDIAALTLNKLSPRYVVMKRGDKEKHKQADTEYGSAVTGALVQSIMLVKKEPRH